MARPSQSAESRPKRRTSRRRPYAPRYADGVERTRDGLIAYLQQVAEQTGRRPTAALVRELGGPPAVAFAKIFGSWRNALVAAGLMDPEWSRSKASSPQQYLDKDLIAALRRYAYERGSAPSQQSWSDWTVENPDAPSVMTIIHRFGSWRRALVVAGLTPQDQRVGRVIESRMKAVRHIQQAVQHLGVTDLTISGYRTWVEHYKGVLESAARGVWGDPPDDPDQRAAWDKARKAWMQVDFPLTNRQLVRIFGDWNAVRDLARVPSVDTMMDGLRHVTQALGRFPEGWETYDAARATLPAKLRRTVPDSRPLREVFVTPMGAYRALRLFDPDWRGEPPVEPLTPDVLRFFEDLDQLYRQMGCGPSLYKLDPADALIWQQEAKMIFGSWVVAQSNWIRWHFDQTGEVAVLCPGESDHDHA